MRENHIKKMLQRFSKYRVLFYKRMIYHFKNILFSENNAYTTHNQGDSGTYQQSLHIAPPAQIPIFLTTKPPTKPSWFFVSFPLPSLRSAPEVSCCCIVPAWSAWAACAVCCAATSAELTSASLAFRSSICLSFIASCPCSVSIVVCNTAITPAFSDCSNTSPLERSVCAYVLQRSTRLRMRIRSANRIQLAFVPLINRLLRYAYLVGYLSNRFHGLTPPHYRWRVCPIALLCTPSDHHQAQMGAFPGEQFPQKIESLLLPKSFHFLQRPFLPVLSTRHQSPA